MKGTEYNLIINKVGCSILGPVVQGKGREGRAHFDLMTIYIYVYIDIVV